MRKPTFAEGEEVLSELRPVFLSFFWRYFIFLFIFIWTAVVAVGMYMNAPALDAALNLSVAPTIEVTEIDDINATTALATTFTTDIKFEGTSHDDKRVRKIEYRIYAVGASEETLANLTWEKGVSEADDLGEYAKDGITSWSFDILVADIPNGSNVIDIRSFDGYDYKSDDYNGNQKTEYHYASFYLNNTAGNVSIDIKGEAPLSNEELIAKMVYESVEGIATIGGGMAGFVLIMAGGYKYQSVRAKTDEEKPSIVKQGFYTLLGTAILAGAGAGFIAMVVWLIGLIIMGLMIGVLMTRLWPVLTYFLIAVIGAGVWWQLVVEQGFRLVAGADGIEILVLYALGMSIFGMFLINIDRTKTRYYITNKGIIMMNGFMKVDERTVRYGSISDVNFEKTIIGRIFDFGNIIPVSKGGMGTGSASSFAAVGGSAEGASIAMGGGKSRTTAVADTTGSLFGIKDPEGVKKLILDEMERPERERRAREEEGLELQRRMAEKLDNIEDQTAAPGTPKEPAEE